MSYLATDKSGEEYIFETIPYRHLMIDMWISKGAYISIPKGSIEKLIGKKLTWEDEPVELTE